MRVNLFLAFLLVFTAHAAAQTPSRYSIETPAATFAGVSLSALASDGSLRVDGEGAARMLPRVVEVRRENADLPAMPTRNFALLTNGDRVPLEPDASAILDDGRVQVWPSGALPGLQVKGVSLFAPHIVLLFWSIPAGVDDAELFYARLEKEARKRDVVYLKNGDRLEGAVTGLSAKDGCTVTTAERKAQVPRAKLAGIAWNTDRQARMRTKKTYWRATLEGGPRLNLLDLAFDEKSRRWHGTTQFGPTLDLPEESILALDVRQGQATDLADLTPQRYEQRAYLGVTWPLTLDASATGHLLRLSGSTFERGLGMHAPSAATYQLDGKYQRFLSLVGIDERSRRGRAKVAILLDGKRIDLNDGKELTSLTAPIPVRLDVRGVRALTLVVELGSFGDVQANVNWAKARLIKNEP